MIWIIVAWLLAIRLGIKTVWRRWLISRPKEQEPSFDEVIATHEAGHVVMAWMSPEVAFVHSVEFDPDGATTKYYLRRDTLIGNWDRLVISMGGIAAEVAVHGRTRMGRAAYDLGRARVRARNLIAARFSLPKIGKNYRTPPFPTIFVRPLAPEENQILSAGYQRARELIDRHRVELDRVRAALRTKQDLDFKKLRKLFGPRLW